MRRIPAGLALAAVAALVLAGCSDDDSATSSDEEVGPLSAFFERVGGSYEEQDVEEQQRKIEELIAACMAEQGFEYTPADSSVFSSTDEDMPDWNSREFAEQYGYGATTMDDMPGGGEEYVDPNADYVAGMSESEQAAYYEALNGPTPEVPEGEEEVETEYNWEEAGCWGKASHEVYEQDQIWSDPELEDVFDEMNKEYDSIQDDPGLRKAGTEWSACMADAGHDFATSDEAQQSVYDEMNALWEAAAPGPDVDPESLDQSAFEPDPAAMAELKEKELALAAADFECKEKSGYEKAQQAAVVSLEKRMWDKYGDQLEAAAAKRTPSE